MRKIFSVALVGLSIACCPPALSSWGRMTYPALKGVKQLGVMVEEVNPEGAQYLNMQQLQTAVELKLRQHGLKVVPPEMADKFLYVSSSMVPPDEGNYTVSFSASVEFCRNVYLTPNSTVSYYGASVWGKHNVGRVGAAKVADIPSAILKDVDTFINDWYGANGR